MDYSSALFIISLLNALMYFSIVAIAIYIVLKLRKAISKRSMTVMSMLGCLAVLRMLVPLDPTRALIIRSDVFIPALQDWLRSQYFDTGLCVGDVILIVWGFVALCFAVYYIKALHKAKCAEDNMPVVDDPKVRACALKLGCRYEIWSSPVVPTPYTSGIRKPVIYFPCLDFSESEIEMALKHEMQHIESRDNLKKLAILFIQVIFWWNPLCYLLRKEFDHLIELRCDAHVTEQYTEVERLEYARMLLNIMTKIGERERKTVLSSHLGSSSYRIKQRFASLLQADKATPKAIKNLIALVVFLLFVATYFVKIQPYSAPPMMDVENAVVGIENGGVVNVLEIDGVFYITSDGGTLIPVPSGEQSDLK